MDSPMSRLDDDQWVAGNETLHSALASIPGISVVVFDHEMRIRALYGTALQRHGYVHERIVGKHMRDAMPAAVWERLAPLYARALSGKTETFEQRAQDGTAWYESTVSPVLRDGRVVAGTMTSRDITAQRAAEEQLRETTERMQAILDHSPMPIFLRDLEQRWIVTNAEVCGFIGKTPEDLLGRSMSETLDASWVEQTAAHDRAVILSGEAASFDEYARDARSGETRHFWSQKFPVLGATGEIVGVGGISLDVTDRERATRELAAARALFERMFASAVVGMLVSRVADDGRIEVIQCNPAFARMLGYDADDLLGVGAISVHPDDEDTRTRMTAALLAGKPATAELRLRHRDGHYIDALAAPSVTDDANGKRLIVLQALDISARKDLETQLQHLADRDSLTGLFSRRRFAEELDRELSRSRRHGRPGAVLLLDLDGFKQVNDLFGHAAGDELLTRIAGSLRGVLRESDVLARIGGDEFALILIDTDLDASRVVAEKLVDAVRAHGRVVVAGQHVEVTASVGITSLDGGAVLSSAQLLAEADSAMYEAKRSGKNRIAVHPRAGALV
jgi:diguanylate cyclase (GGDEF)-like protein/PAS domain S-box-containing protein